MRSVGLFLAVCLSFFGSALPLHAEELADRKAAMEHIHELILARDFTALDKLEHDWRVNRSRTPSGVWQVEVFYNGMWFLGTRSEAPECSDSADAVLAAWRKHSPRSPAPFIASADRLLNTAWCHRGHGMANTVDDEAWEPFKDGVAAAHAMLAQHKAIASLDPHFYAVMAEIYIAEGRHPAEFAALAKEATAREPYYHPFYASAFRYYEPNWYGSHEAEEAVAQQAVVATRAKDRTSAFARVYWTAMDCGCLPPPETLNLPVLRQSMKDLTDLYPDPWNIAHMARMACAIHDPELARHYFDALPSGDDGRAGWTQWANVDTDAWSTCRATAGLSQTALAN